MRGALSCLLCCATLASGATGDFLGGYVTNNGWQAMLKFEGLSTGGTYDFGWGLSNLLSLSSPKLTVSLTSMGYDATGAATTHSRTVYGGARIRQPYPNEATADETAEASDVWIKVSLSDWIYDNDSNVTVDVSSALYTESGNPNNSASSYAISNYSDQAYPSVIANWTWPGNNAATGTTMRLRAIGFHGHATNTPLACMQFIVRDQSAAAVTNTETALTVDQINALELNCGEYVSDFTLASFTEHDLLRCDFVAYPRIGDSGSVFNTIDDTYTGLVPNPTSITNLCDPNNTWSPFVAVVEPSSGSDANGRATNTTYNAVNSAHYFATIATAFNRLADSNNTHAATTHNDVGGSTVYLRTTGTTLYDWTGGSISATGPSECWVVVTTYPGDSLAWITNRLNDRDAGDMIHLLNIGIGGSPNAPFHQINHLWLDQSTLNCSGTQPIYGVPLVYVTHCYITNWAQSLWNVSGQNCSYSLIRGNDMDGFDDDVLFWTMLGNTHADTNGSAYGIYNGYTARLNHPPEYQILYNNYFGGFRTVGSPVHFGLAVATTNGLAIVGNVFEGCNSDNTSSFICGEDSLDYTNILVWHNTFMGMRTGMAYNDTGTAADWRVGWSVKNNFWMVHAVKADLVAPESGNRIGSWPCLWGVNWSGNFMAELTNTSAASAFPMEFNGVTSRKPGNGDDTTTTNDVSFVQVLCWDGYQTAQPGGSDLHIQTDGLANGLECELLMTYDQDGEAFAGKVMPGVFNDEVSSAALVRRWLRGFRTR